MLARRQARSAVIDSNFHFFSYHDFSNYCHYHQVHYHHPEARLDNIKGRYYHDEAEHDVQLEDDGCRSCYHARQAHVEQEGTGLQHCFIPHRLLEPQLASLGLQLGGCRSPRLGSPSGTLTQLLRRHRPRHTPINRCLLPLLTLCPCCELPWSLTRWLGAELVLVSCRACAIDS